MLGIRHTLAMLVAVALCSAASAQRLPSLGTITPSEALVPAVLIHPVVPCVKSPEPFDVDDYDGPFNQLVARFSQRVEKATVHLPRRHTNLRPCSLSAGEKFRLFADQQMDPINFVAAGFNASLNQAESTDYAYGEGVQGFGKRYSATLADSATGSFFGVFVYPAIFHQDPRYYRMGRNGFKARLGHALAHRFVAISDSGHPTFNYSEWFGTVSTKLVSNAYHPGNPRGFGPTATRVGFSVANDMGWDVLREFWPEVAHKFKLPFRTRQEPYALKNPAPPAPARPAAAVANAPAAVGVQ